MNLLNQMERKLSRVRIPPFMRYIVCGMGCVFLLDMFFPTLGVGSLISLNWRAVMRGQVWRLVTFVFSPPNNSLIFILFSLYFYYMIGSTLENRWGTRRFFIFYLFGMVGAIIAAAITGYGTNMYLNYSMFFAFAAMYPDMEMLMFFVIPIKMKYLALLDALFFISEFVYSPWSGRAALLASILNLIFFFGGDIINIIRQEIARIKRKILFKKSMRR